MSHGGRAENAMHLTQLRSAIARIEAGGAMLEHGPRGRMVLGAQATQLDVALGGGLARGALHEIIPAGAPDRAAATGFALVLALRFASTGRGTLVWIGEDFASLESGALYGPGLAAFGLDPARLLVVQAAQGEEALWAMEEALKCRALAAVVGELWDVRACDLTASRRLALAARASGTPGLLLQARAPPASAATTRLEVRAASAPAAAQVLRGKPLPGPPTFAVRLQRARGALQLDPDHAFLLIFDPVEGQLRDFDPAPRADAGTLSADAGERPHPPLAVARQQGQRRSA